MRPLKRAASLPSRAPASSVASRSVSRKPRPVPTFTFRKLSRLPVDWYSDTATRASDRRSVRKGSGPRRSDCDPTARTESSMSWVPGPARTPRSS